MVKVGTVRTALDGVEVSIGRNTENDQLIVHVNTEGFVERAGDGCPFMELTLNDATLYDRESEARRPSIASDYALELSADRAEARRLMAIKLADRDVHQADIEVLDSVEYRDGGYWVGARIWVDMESVEHACGFVALASDSVADVNGRDARFTRTDDGE